MKEETRVGVFICRCGDEIGEVLDVARMVRSVKRLSQVRYVSSGLYPCSGDGLAEMKGAISESRLNRIVVAGCTPRTHGPLFRRGCQEAGLNGHLFEMVNIREHCSRVHAYDKATATRKAIDLIRMGVARVCCTQPREKIRSGVQPSALVIGAGISGMTAALSLAQKGVAVKLVEKEDRMGGLIRDMYLLYPTYTDSREFLDQRIKAVEEDSHIETFLASQVTKVAGHVGDYEITIETEGREETFHVGVIVVATGSDLFEPVGMYGYGEDPRVITQMAFEAVMRRGDLKAKEIVMIQCVGARIDERPYCSRHCCLVTIMNAVVLKERAPDKNITVLFRGLTEYIQDFDRAQELGVRFIRYDPPTLPQVGDGVISVEDAKTGMKHQIAYDLIVLATPLVPRMGAPEMARMLKIPVDEWGFLVEPQTKLRPGEHVPSGVFVAGAAHWPAIIGECIDQGHGAACRALVPIEVGTVEKEPIVSSIDQEICRGCGQCAETCQFQAIELITGEDGIPQARLDEFLCTGCGVCASVCPCGAISVDHLPDLQIRAILETAMAG